MKLKLFFTFIVLTGLALAAGTSATLTWTLATSYIDGTPLPVSNIKETFIQWYRPGSTTPAGGVHVSAPNSTVVMPNLICGQYNFTAETILNSGPNSDESSPVIYDTNVVCKPNPPSGLAAQ